MTQTLNLDALLSEKKVMILGGKEFDVTRMPLAIFIKLQKRARENALDIPAYQDLIADWFTQINPEITPEWVKSQTEDAIIFRTIQHNLFDKVLMSPLEEFPLKEKEKEKERKTSTS